MNIPIQTNRLAIATFLLGLLPWILIGVGFLVNFVFLQFHLQWTRRGDVVDIITSVVACLRVNLCFISPAGYITGIMALNQISNSQGKQKGKLWAMVGMTLIALLLIPFAYSR
jgi:hypothetical protein